jgi:hypothetical protein
MSAVLPQIKRPPVELALASGAKLDPRLLQTLHRPGRSLPGERQGESIATGIEALDRILPDGGLPRGHVTQMTGARGSGRTSFTVGLIAQLAARGERAALVDLEGDLDPAAFEDNGIPAGAIWVVTPRSTEEGLWAADLLVRSGHFALVVLDGVEGPLRTAALVRLQRWARESNAALLVGTGGRRVAAPGSLQLDFRGAGAEWEEGLGGSAGPVQARFSVQVSKGRCEALARFRCRPRVHLSRHAHIADRRPAKWTERAKSFGEQRWSWLPAGEP